MKHGHQLIIVALLIGLGLSSTAYAQEAPSETTEKPKKPRVVPPKLVSERPVVECAALPFDSKEKFKVSLIVSTEGKAEEIQLVKSSTTACSDLVINAVKNLSFSPAQVDEKPAAVRIRWTVLVKGPPKPKPPPKPTSDIEGKLQERGSRQVLPGLVVKLLPYNVQAITDKNGVFVFESVPEGPVTLLVPSYDHEEFQLELEVPLQEKLVLKLQPLPKSKYRISVERQRPDASRVIVSAKEAAEIPGGAGDPVKVIEVMPGVARVSAAGPNAGQIIVRGSAPEDTKNFIDGLPSPQLYHFGNLYSILQEVYIDTVDFRTGGFSVEYGDALGGILNLTLAPIPTDGSHFEADVNVYHTSIAGSTTIGDKWAVSAGVRRSYIDAILPAILEGSGAGADLIAAPVYYDYQVRADYNPDPKGQLRILAYGSDDKLAVEFAEPAAQDPQTTGFGINQRVHQIQAYYEYKFSRDFNLSAGITSGYQGVRFNIGEDRTFKLRVCPLVLRSEFGYRISNKLRLRAGVLGSTQNAGVKLNLPRRGKEGQVDDNGAGDEVFNIDVVAWQNRLDAWTELQYNPVKTVGLILGARSANWLGSFSDSAAEPRLTLYWQALENTQLSFGAGLNYQAPLPDETADQVGNPDLLAERSIYSVLGLKQQFSDIFSFNLQFFSKELSSLVSPVPFDFENPNQLPYDNAATGSVIGGEILAQLATERFTAWLSYSLSRSVRTDRPGEPERLFSFDQTHVLSFVSSVIFGAGFTGGVRVRYSTGNPFTPLTTGYYDASSDVYVPRPVGSPLSARLQDFFALDVRISKEFRFDNWLLETYLEVNNATNRENVENVGYSYDYSERSDINGLPLVPSFGLKAVY